jgi:hypothetical protein
MTAEKTEQHRQDADVGSRALTWFARRYRPYVIDVENVIRFGATEYAQNVMYAALDLGLCVGVTWHDAAAYGCPTPRARWSMGAFADARVVGESLSPRRTHLSGAPCSAVALQQAMTHFHMDELLKVMGENEKNLESVKAKEAGVVIEGKKDPLFCIQDAALPFGCVCKAYSNPRSGRNVWKANGQYYTWTDRLAALMLGFPPHYHIVTKLLTPMCLPETLQSRNAARQIAGALSPPYAQAKATLYREIATKVQS